MPLPTPLEHAAGSLTGRTVGFDYLPAVHHPPGIGRYVRELVRALVRLEGCPRLRLLELGRGAGEMDGDPLGLDGAGADVRRIRIPLPRRFFSTLGRVGLGAERFARGIDIFHRALPGYPPVSAVPQVLPVPELPAAGSSADQELGAACRRAARVLVFCEAYVSAVGERYGLDPRRVVRAHVGCEHWARELSASGRAIEPSARPTLVVLGAIRHERRPLEVLAGFEELRRGGVDAELVLVGRPAGCASELRTALRGSSHSAHVRWIAEPVEHELPELVARATALVHLAEDEGTPVTVLEALAAGAAVAASPLPAFREALGDQATWVEDRAPRGVALALEEALRSGADEAARQRRRLHAAPWTWRRHAEEALEVWADILGPRQAGSGP